MLASHGFASVCLGMKGNATSCDGEPGLVQTQDTKVKPGGGGCRQGVDKPQWKNQLHHQGSVKKSHTGLEISNPSSHMESEHTPQSESTVRCYSYWKGFHPLSLWRKSALLLKLFSLVKKDTGILQAY